MRDEPFLTIRQATAEYPVFVGRGLIARIGELVSSRGRVFVITSTTLREKFGVPVARSFHGADILTIDEGESFKTIETANAVITQLIERGAKRDSMAVVVG